MEINTLSLYLIIHNTYLLLFILQFVCIGSKSKFSDRSWKNILFWFWILKKFILFLLTAFLLHFNMLWWKKI